MRALLDINVLLALLDPMHIHHDAAHDWFGAVTEREWASCPITQNGYVRIASQPRYSNPVATGEAASLLAEFTGLPGHEFWPDSISLINSSLCDVGRLNSARQVTDTYLLALARSYGGKLATFDDRLPTRAVSDGAEHVLLLGRAPRV